MVNLHNESEDRGRACRDAATVSLLQEAPRQGNRAPGA